MSWNYRIVKTEKGHGLFEVYYEDSGKPYARSTDPVLNFYCDTQDELSEIIDMIKSSLHRNMTTLTDADIGITD